MNELDRFLSQHDGIIYCINADGTATVKSWYVDRNGGIGAELAAVRTVHEARAFMGY